MTAPMPAGPGTANRALLLLGAAYFLVEWLPGVTGAYGYFIDEFYYLACADHPAFGYVDHPSLSVALLWLWRSAAGDSLVALRFPINREIASG